MVLQHTHPADVLTCDSCTNDVGHAGLAFVGNGKHLVSAGRDASVCFWSPSVDSGEKFIAERMARLQAAYEGGTAPHAGSPVLVRQLLHLLCSSSKLLMVAFAVDGPFPRALSACERRFKDMLAATASWSIMQSSWPSTVSQRLCGKLCGPRMTSQLSGSSMWSRPRSLQTAGT